MDVTPVLAWGLGGDPPFDAVVAALARRRVPTLVADQACRAPWRIEDAAFAAPALRIGGAVHSLGDIGAAFVRPLRELTAPECALADGLESTAALVMNRLRAAGSNDSKPYQAARIAAAGFETPPTIATTDPQEARRFLALHPRAICKSLSAHRSIVRRIDEASLERLSAVANCPTQFQEFIEGEDYRAHVIGPRVVTTRIECDADDYRYAAPDGRPPRLVAASLPVEIEERCVALTRRLGLALSGIDLRRARDGRWYCFEVNPSPAFTYYEAGSAYSIAELIVDALIAGHDAAGTAAPHRFESGAVA